MAIVQISKIQQRSGNLVDLPQLDNGEFGWASDEKLLYIGRTDPGPTENIEVLTSYSTINFSQLNGSEGDLNIVNAANGEVLTFDGSNWVNHGGVAGGLIDLGSIANVKIGGGAIGYVLETDGLGNLSWTSKGTIVANIIDVSSDNPAIMTVANTTPYTNATKITITGVQGANANTILNGQDFYIKLDVDFPTNGNVELYTDVGLTTPVNGTDLTATPNTGIATSSLGVGSTSAGGSEGTVQFNASGFLTGSGDFTWNNSGTKLLTINGNISAGNLNVNGTITGTRLISNISTGTAPLTVTSTTRVANLNVAYANVSDYEVVTAQSTGIYYPVFINNSSTGNYAAAANSIFSANIANGALIATTFVGSLSGTATSATTAGTVTTAAQPNITSTGILSNLSVTGNVSSGGIKTDNYYYSNGTPISFAGTYGNSNVANYLPTFTGILGAGSATHYGTTLTTGANTTAGTITGNWTLSSGSKLQSTYADLAEYYEADCLYDAATVLEFGGNKEVTIAMDESVKVAGVVSSNPAYVMNANCPGYAVPVTLQGRVPVKVRGTVQKGDILVSSGDGYAKTSNDPKIGTVLGKALANFDGIEGIIEIAVGRL